MITYTYQREDGTRFDYRQSVSDDALQWCPKTGQEVRRVIHAPHVQFKGRGFYETDYKGK